MENKDRIFSKIPDWLRWICALPFAFLVYFVLITALKGLFLYTGYDLKNTGLPTAIVKYGSLTGFLLAFYFCVPKFKRMLTGILSMVFSIQFGFCILFVFYNNLTNWDFIISLLGFKGFLIFSIMMFIKC